MSEPSEALMSVGVEEGPRPPPIGDREYGALVEQYKLYVEMADRVSQRRQVTNGYFLTIHTLLLSGLGTFWSLVPVADSARLVVVVAFTGIVLCFVWWRLVLSHKGLNSGKFAVVHQLEQRLPAQPYAAEWITIGEGKDRKRYWPVTHLEMWVPWVFAGAYVAALPLAFFAR